MQELAEEKTSQYQEDIIEIISKAKKKKKALKKIAKLNAEKDQWLNWIPANLLLFYGSLNNRIFNGKMSCLYLSEYP